MASVQYVADLIRKCFRFWKRADCYFRLSSTSPLEFPSASRSRLYKSVTRPRMASAILRFVAAYKHEEVEQAHWSCLIWNSVTELKWVSQFVSAHRHKTLTLKRPAGVVLRIAELSDTMYKDNHKELSSWGKFYLPNEVNMHVVGFMEDGCGQLILMTCEDKKLYIYDGEELHEVASSLEQLRHKKIEYPASKTYYYGEPFKDMTAKDWEEVRKSDLGRRLDKEHEKLVRDSKAKFLEMLSSQK